MKNILFKDDLIQEYSAENDMIVDVKSPNVLTDDSIEISERNQKILDDLSDFNIGIENQLNHFGQFLEVTMHESKLISDMLYFILENTLVDFVQHQKNNLRSMNYFQLDIIDIKKSKESIFIDFAVDDIQTAYAKLKKMKQLTLSTVNDYFQTSKYVNFSCYNINNRIQILISSNEKEYVKDLMSSIVQYLHQDDDGYMLRAIIGYDDYNVDSIDLLKYSSILISGGTGSGKTKELESIILSTLILNKEKYIDITTLGFREQDGDIFNHLNLSKTSTINIKKEDNINELLDKLLFEIQSRKELLNRHNLKSWEEYVTLSLLDNKAKDMPFKIFVFDEFSSICRFQKEDFFHKLENIVDSCEKLGIVLIFSTHDCQNFSDKFISSIKLKMQSVGGYIHQPTMFKLFGLNFDLTKVLNNNFTLRDRVFYTSESKYLKTLLFTNNTNYSILLYNYLNS